VDAPRCLAFYLPQFHPIAENDAWWGPGFTEWVNVAPARPQFRGHQQPHVPADLGFYDLRLAETREQQATLARSHGIDGFCYYHYWFEGRRLLGRPFDEVRRLGEPDFPFCLCWANEDWTRVWNGRSNEVLIRQTYSPEDDLNHIRWLAEGFSDPRYLRVGGRPVLLVYRASQLPEPERTADTWREETSRLGIGEVYLCAVQSFATDRDDPARFGFDAAVQFAPDFTYRGRPDPVLLRAGRRYLRPRSPYRRNRVLEYADVADTMLRSPAPPYKRYPCVSPGFDNSPRRAGGATILRNSSPQRYESWLAEVVRRFRPFSPEENLLFVNAWNEWAEGNHLEPCQRWGRGFLEAHARVLRGRREVLRPVDAGHVSQMGPAGG
jgi:lipopolysaccharide biosynthesis protein